MRLIRASCTVLVGILLLIPHKKTKLIFSSKYGFSDNSKYLFLYHLKRGSKCIWVASCNTSYRVVTEVVKEFSNGSVIKRNSLLLIPSLARAKYVFVTHSFQDLGGMAVKTCPVINLWHGIPIKKMGFDSQNDIALFSLETFNPYQNNDFVISSSKATKPFFESCMALNSSKILPLGQPRNDFLMENRGNRILTNRLRQNYCANDESRLILYAPTFRDINSNGRNIYLSLIQSFKKHSQKGDILVLRLHPKEKKFLTHFELPENIKHSRLDDVQEELLAADIMVSDYSSIIFDYSILRRPIFLYAPDRNVYFKNRGGSYFDYDDILCECREIKRDQIDSMWNSLRVEEVNYPLLNSLHVENACKSISQRFNL